MSWSTFSTTSATAIIVANMVGTGVFTSLGFQLQEIQSPLIVLALWLVGGLSALCGALSYAELGAALPRSGGEYHFISVIYHRSMGFVSGWISSTIGFAAPTALAAITFGHYLSALYPGLSVRGLALGLIIVLTGVHMRSHHHSSIIQLTFTITKLLLIVIFSVSALWLAPHLNLKIFDTSHTDWRLLGSGEFAVALIYVNYAFNGWNAATYVSGEVKNPQRALPKILLRGTALVAVAYLLLNGVFMLVAPANALQGKVEIGIIAARFAFGEGGAIMMGTALAMLLISTVSAMIIAGPRVLQMMGEDYAEFRWLSKTNHDRIPARAIAIQSLLACLFVLSGSFQSVLLLAGFALSLNNLATVLGVFVLRWWQPDLDRPFRISGYPLPPIIYSLLTTWTLVYLLINKPVESFASLGLVAAGFLFYGLRTWLRRRADTHTV